MVSRLCDDGVQGRDGRCVENSSCFQIVLFVPVCILLLGSPAGLINTIIDSHHIYIYIYICILYIDSSPADPPGGEDLGGSPQGWG